MGQQNGLNPTFIFMPDISGFTSFINDVEVSHSVHIISELLEIIIDSNILDLKVSEIEGDAILFYRIGSKPSIEELSKQSEKMFLQFHRHLQLYDRDRICQCGACSTASNLTLKFVSHFGEATIRKIRNIETLMGPDITLAHKLLKNNIPSHEYVLFTDSLNEPNNVATFDNIIISQDKNNYEGVGDVLYNYYSLSSIKSKISELPERPIHEKYRTKVSISITINSSLENVHSILSNVSLKPKWVIGLKSVKEESNSLNVVGSKHLCILPSGDVDFELTSQQISDGMIEFVEKTDTIKWLAPMHMINSMKRISQEKTKVIMRVNYRDSLLSRIYLDFPLRIMMFVVVKLSLMKLKKHIAKLV